MGLLCRVLPLFQRLFLLHSRGPYANLKDLSASHYIDIHLFSFSKTECVHHQVSDQSCVTPVTQSELLNKDSYFDDTIGFVVKPCTPLGGGKCEPLNMNDLKA